MIKPLLPISGLSQLASRYDVILSDIWGVVHNGIAAFPDACAALTEFRRLGGTVILITNAPRPNGLIVQQLKHLGAPRDIYDAIVTSGDVSLAYMQAQGTKKLHHIGPVRDLALYDALRPRVKVMPKLVPLAEADYVLCTGLVEDIVAPEDYDVRPLPDDILAVLRQMKSRDLPMVCANPDVVVHVGDELIYCAGALGEAYRAMGGQVIYSGKPFAPIYDECLVHARKLRGLETPKAKILAIGDAIRTDVAGAVSQGMDVLMVTGGIHRDEMHNARGEIDVEKIEVFLQGAEHRPFALIEALRW